MSKENSIEKPTNSNKLLNLMRMFKELKETIVQSKNTEKHKGTNQKTTITSSRTEKYGAEIK